MTLQQYILDLYRFPGKFLSILITSFQYPGFLFSSHFSPQIIIIYFLSLKFAQRTSTKNAKFTTTNRTIRDKVD